MDALIGFGLGVLLGASIGVVIMACCVASSRDRREGE